MKKILDLIKTKEKLDGPLVIGIDGRCGSGKSTLANELKSILDCQIIHMDDFFLQPYQRNKTRLEEIGGNFDYERFIEQVKNPLLNKKDFSYQRFDCSSMSLMESISININKIIIIEGTYSCHPLLEDIYDVIIFVDIDRVEQINRIRNRDGEFLLTRFIEEWIPKEEAYFKEFMIKEKANFVIKR